MGNRARTGRVKARATPHVPRSRDGVGAQIAAIGELQRERTRLETRMNDELASVKARYEADVGPVNAAIKDLSEGVQTWCEAHREELLDGRRKFCRFATGQVQWRMGPPKVKLARVKELIARLQADGPRRFLRTKVEVNKEAMLAEPALAAGIRGVSIVQDEDFVITPFETKLEEVS